MKKIKKLINYVKLYILLKKFSKNNTIIIVFANYQYKKILDNWLFAIQKNKIKNFLIISLDKELFNYLKKNDIQTYYFKTEINLKELWINRIILLKQILNLGYNFIHSDADAIWLKDPLGKFFYNLNYDVIFSEGTVWPSNIHAKWGFVLCCGFFGIKSNIATRKLLDDVYHDVNNSGDDQVSFNNIIQQHGTKWKIDENYELIFKGKSFICSKKIIYGNNPYYKVALLPHYLFQRVNEDTKTVYIKHLISEKKSESIVELLKKNDLFFIEKNVN